MNSKKVKNKRKSTLPKSIKNTMKLIYIKAIMGLFITLYVKLLFQLSDTFIFRNEIYDYLIYIMKFNYDRTGLIFKYILNSCALNHTFPHINVPIKYITLFAIASHSRFNISSRPSFYYQIYQPIIL